MKYALPLGLMLSFCAVAACSAQTPVNDGITYDQIEKKEGVPDIVLSTDVKLSQSTRISTLSERFFCENQTLDIDVARRFEEQKRVGVDLSVKKNGEKLSRLEISKASKNIEDYRFYDMDFSCVNGYFGVTITGYKIGMNGARPSAEVFNYHVFLESGEPVPMN